MPGSSILHGKRSATGAVEGPFLTKSRASKNQMKGKGAVQSTMPGVMGATKQDSFQRSLGGLLNDTADGPLGPGIATTVLSTLSIYGNTDHGLLMSKSATPMPGAHYGQVPYPGAYASHLGARVS
jgi:hypothetical protein